MGQYGGNNPAAAGVGHQIQVPSIIISFLKKLTFTIFSAATTTTNASPTEHSGTTTATSSMESGNHNIISFPILNFFLHFPATSPTGRPQSTSSRRRTNEPTATAAQSGKSKLYQNDYFFSFFLHFSHKIMPWVLLLIKMANSFR
jgi:hypothetical protein